MHIARKKRHDCCEVDGLRHSDGGVRGREQVPRPRKNMKARLCLAVLPMLLCHAALAYTTDSNGKIIHTDGSSADVQAAVNAASDGWTVVIPDGAHSWSSGITISGKGIHLKGSGVNTVSISGSASPKISVTKDSTHPVEISGIKFSSGSLKIRVTGSWAARPVIVHDCAFFENLSASMLFLVNGGLIYNCAFTGSGGYNDQAVKVKAQSDDGGQWYSPDTMGLRDSNGERNVYVENCTFTNLLLQCFDFDDYARMVVRNSTFSDSAITSHGADTSAIGLRQMEVYGNRFIFHNFGDCDGSKTPNMDYFIYVRGGTGCIYSNVMDNMSSCAWGNKSEIKLTVYNITRNGGQVPCQTSYPAFHQIGQGHNGSSYFTDPLYIWANSTVTDVGVVQYSPDECGNGQKIANYLQSGRDFITGAARPGYAAYTYPHPLRSSGGTVAPLPATIVASPTSLSVTQNMPVTMTALASGSSPMTYQWQKNQANLPGATAATYSDSSAQSADAGAYRCIAANAYGSATSAVANLNVIVPVAVAPTIITSPQSLTRTVSELASFTVSAGGTAPLSYQWQKNMANIPGATNSTHTIVSVALGDAGAFRCVVANSLGSATSASATLTVSTAAVGRVWYVDQTAGSDSNGGSPSSPWKRCPGMVGWTGSATLLPGDTVYFDLADTWDMGANSSGAGLDLKAGVRYVGNEWNPQGAVYRRAMLRAIGKHEAGVVRIWEDHATHPTWIQGFEINANGYRANLVDINHAFWKTGLTKGVKRVENCVAHSNAGNGLEGDYKYGIIVSDNSSDASGWVANVEILNTKVYNVPRDGICLYPGDRGMISNVVVRGCEIYGTGTDPSYSEGHGLMMKGNVKNSVVEFSYAHDVNSSAVFVNGPEAGSGTGPSGCIVRYNILQTADNNGVIRFYGTGSKGVDIYGNLILPNEAKGGLSFDGCSGTHSVKVYNNTFYNAYVDIGSPSSTGTIDLKNNILYELDDTPLSDPAQKITSHANNLFYRSGGGTLVSRGGISFTAANLTSGFEATGSASNPGFKNAASLPTGFTGVYGVSLAPNSDGLGLLSSSPVISAGANLGASYIGSINTVSRPASSGWAMGAYQLDLSGASAPQIPTGLRILVN
jgi:hypothetical protein